MTDWNFSIYNGSTSIEFLIICVSVHFGSTFGCVEIFLFFAARIYEATKPVVIPIQTSVQLGVK